TPFHARRGTDRSGKERSSNGTLVLESEQGLIRVCDFAVSRRFAPRRGVGSPPGLELLGVITSHGPSRESIRPSRKSSGAAKATSPPIPRTVLSAERMRPVLSSAADESALLQRGVPEGSTEMVEMEGAAEIS